MFSRNPWHAFETIGPSRFWPLPDSGRGFETTCQWLRDFFHYVWVVEGNRAQPGGGQLGSRAARPTRQPGIWAKRAGAAPTRRGLPTPESSLARPESIAQEDLLLAQEEHLLLVQEEDLLLAQEEDLLLA